MISISREDYDLLRKVRDLASRRVKQADIAAAVGLASAGALHNSLHRTGFRLRLTAELVLITGDATFDALDEAHEIQINEPAAPAQEPVAA